MKLKMLASLFILSSICWGQNNQHQGQRQQQNVDNTTTNSHNNVATGGQSSATGGQGGSSTAEVGGQQNAQSTTENTNIPRQTSSAFAPPPFHTSPCVKSWGGAAQTGVAGLSLGAGKVDRGCDIRETAAEFASQGSMVAYCKVLITEPNAKKAGVTFADCMAVPPAPAVAPVAAIPNPPPFVITPSITINPVIERPSQPVLTGSLIPASVPNATKARVRKPLTSNCPK